MADHKFVYTISGVDLTEAQKAKISDGLGAVVATALVGASATALKSGVLNVGNIHGGLWIDVASVGNVSVPELMKRTAAT